MVMTVLVAIAVDGEWETLHGIGLMLWRTQLMSNGLEGGGGDCAIAG